MRQYLKGYATNNAITDNLLQTTRSEGKAYIFGKSELNLKYARVLKKEMEECGHPVNLLFTSAKHTMMNICKYVTEDHNRRLKLEKKTQLTGADRTQFMANWLKENKNLMDLQLGLEPLTDSPCAVHGEDNLYLRGILFTTAASIQTVPQLQEGIQGDAAHMQFGKYMLF